MQNVLFFVVGIYAGLKLSTVIDQVIKPRMAQRAAIKRAQDRLRLN